MDHGSIVGWSSFSVVAVVDNWRAVLVVAADMVDIVVGIDVDSHLGKPCVEVSQ